MHIGTFNKMLRQFRDCPPKSWIDIKEHGKWSVNKQEAEKHFMRIRLNK